MRSLISRRFDGSRGVAAKSVAGAAATTLAFLAFCWVSAPQQPAESAVTPPLIDFEPIPPMTFHDVYLGWSRMPEWQPIDRHWITQTTDRRARLEITRRSQAVAQSQGAAPDPQHSATPMPTPAPVVVASLRPDAFAHRAELGKRLADSLAITSAILGPRAQSVPEAEPALPRTRAPNGPGADQALPRTRAPNGPDAEPALPRTRAPNWPDAERALPTPALAGNHTGARVPPALGAPPPTAKPVGEHAPDSAQGHPFDFATGLSPAGNDGLSPARYDVLEDIALDTIGNDDFPGFGPGGPIGLPDFAPAFGPPFNDHAGPPFDPGFAPPANGPPNGLPTIATRSLKAPFTHGKTFAIATVPEPGTAALLVLGLGLLAGRGRWLRC